MERRFADDVIIALEMGAEGRFTESEITDKLKELGVDLQGVHLLGANGLFEKGHDDKCRLNISGLNLLMAHLSIKKAETQAISAKYLAIAALVFTGLALVFDIIAKSF